MNNTLTVLFLLAEMCPATPGNYAWNLQQGRRLADGGGGGGQRRSNSLTTAAAAAAVASEAAAMTTRLNAAGEGDVGDVAAGGRRHSGNSRGTHEIHEFKG